MVASRLNSSDKSNWDVMTDPSPGHYSWSWSWFWSWIGRKAAYAVLRREGGVRKRERGPSSLGMCKESFKGLWFFGE